MIKFILNQIKSLFNYITTKKNDEKSNLYKDSEIYVEIDQNKCVIKPKTDIYLNDDDFIAIINILTYGIYKLTRNMNDEKSLIKLNIVISHTNNIDNIKSYTTKSISIPNKDIMVLNDIYTNNDCIFEIPNNVLKKLSFLALISNFIQNKIASYDGNLITEFKISLIEIPWDFIKNSFIIYESNKKKNKK